MSARTSVRRWRQLLPAATIVLLAAASLAACNKRPVKQAAGDQPHYFRHIPADSPFVFTTAGPLDPASLARAAAQAKKTLAMVQTVTFLLPDEPWANVARALVTEMSSAAHSKQGMASLGLNGQGEISFYGLGLVPVVRWEATDPGLARAAIIRVLGAGKLQLPTVGKGRRSLWRVDAEGATLLFGVPDDALVISLTKTPDVARVLPYLLGESSPVANMANTPVLKELLALEKLLPQQVGFVDNAQLTKIFLGLGTVLAEESRVALGVDLQASEVCKQEIMSIAAFAPRWIFGTQRANAAGTSYVLRLTSARPEIMTALGALVRPMPLHELPGPESSTLARIGVSLDMAGLGELMTTWAASAAANPYKCEWLDGVNEFWSKFTSELERDPLPEVLAGFRGAVAIVREFDMSSNSLKIDAFGFVDTTKAAATLALIKKETPFLAQATLPKPGEIVRVAISQAVPGAEVGFIAAHESLLGFGVGANTESELPKLLAQSAPSGPVPLFVFTLDPARVLPLLRAAELQAASLNFSTDERVRLAVFIDAGGLRMEMHWDSSQ